MTRVKSILVAVVWIAAQTWTHAEVIELEGTIKSIDAGSRAISIVRKTPSGEKVLDLEIAKTAGDFSSLTAGSKISFSYDPNLELVTKITGQDSPAAAGQELVALKELRKGYNTAPWVSEDGLRLFWQSAEQDGTRWIWTASRSKPNGLWEGQAKVVPGSDVTLTSDELNLFVFEAGTICVASRQSRDDSFSRPERIEELKDLGTIARPCVSPDGLLLWFDKIGEGGGQTYRVARSKVDEPWGKPVVVDRAAVGGGNGFYVNPVDGYGLFAMQTPLVEGYRFAIARTADKGLRFSDPQSLSIPDKTDGKMPFYCKATKELFFAGHPGPDKTSQLYVVRNFVLPFHSAKAPSASQTELGDTAAEVLKELQGEWLMVSGEENGQQFERADVKRQNRRLLIKGKTLTMERLKGNVAKWTGRFTIDPETKAFDWVGTNSQDAETKWIGIYSVDGDTLKLCFRFNIDGQAKRPSSFSSGDFEKPNATAFYTFKRDND